MTRFARFSLCLLACLGVGLRVAAAGTIINTSPGNNQANMTSQAGQTFTTPTLGVENLLSTIAVNTRNAFSTGDPTGPFTLKLFVDTDGDYTTWDPGTLVATSTNSAALTPALRTLVTYTFSNEPLSSSTVYAVSFNDGSNDHAAFGSSVTNAGGVALTSGALFSGGTQPFGGAYDMAFQVVTVPEPGTLAAIGLAALSAAGWYRRRAALRMSA